MDIKEIWSKYHVPIIVVLVLIAGYYFLGARNSANLYSESYSGSTMDIASSSFGKVSSPGISSGGSRPPAPSEPGYTAPVDRKIRKTANVRLETPHKNYESDKNSFEGIISKYGGFYISKQESTSNYGGKDYKTYYVTFKVPVASFDAAIEDVKHIGTLKDMNINADDLTTQYQDTKNYLDNYIKERERLLALYDKAINVGDVVQIESRITEVQRLIDSYQQQLTNLDRQTEYSTITAALSEEKDPIQSFYQMTSLPQHIANIARSFDSLFVFFSSAIAWIIAIIVGIVLYKVYKKMSH